MGKLMRFLGLASLGAAIYLVLNDRFAGQSGVNGESAGSWGAKQRMSGTGNQLSGKLKKGVGDLVGDDKLSGSGVADQVTGTLKDVAGKAATAVQGAVDDLKS